MISSMTGYGRAESRSRGITMYVELRSVNSRFCDISIRIPRIISNYEDEIKRVVQTQLNRGKISVNISIDGVEAEMGNFKIDHELLKNYFTVLEELKEAAKLNDPIKLDHLLSISDLIKYETKKEDESKIFEIVRKGLLEAITNLQKMRSDEGRELARDIRSRIVKLGEYIDKIERYSEERSKEEYTKLRKRIKNLISDTEVDEHRLYTELALMADKVDVTEECVRFRSHNQLFLRYLDQSEPVGKKLNFLLQEMNREANTIGSKAMNSQISHIVVEIKNQIEKIREQVQNIQ